MSAPSPALSSRPRPVWKTALLYFLRTFILMGVVVIFLALTVRLYPPAFVWGLGLLGRKPMCSSGEVLRGAAQRYRYMKVRENMRSQRRLISQDAAGYHLWETPGSRLWIPSGSDDVVPVLVAQQAVGLYEIGGHGPKAGDVVLDCGAHVGVYTRKALALGAKLVVAIEPAPDNLECLRRNLRDEIAAGRVVVVPKGVWDKEDKLPLFEHPRNSAAATFVRHSNEDVTIPNIPLTTIDKLAEELKLPKVDVIKLDIKGATQRALTGARRTLESNRPQLIISTEETDDNAVRITNFVAGLSLGYRPECGMCSVSENRVWPETLFFRGPAGSATTRASAP